ncbi:MAG TPA: histidine phosphatase family protein [Burkholderiales bacterium]|nr:histidine phosphatase family protein [Burkholderiales bacterium]
MSQKIPMFTKPFYYLRHGQTETNAHRLVAGSLDVDLTPLGREQALAAAKALAREPITQIYSSPLKRARHTAEPIAKALNVPIAIIAEIAERNWGDLEGKPRGSRRKGVMPSGAETTEAFSDRVLAGFCTIDADVPLVVAHSGVFRVLCRTLGIVEAEAPVANATPLRFVPHSKHGWKIEEA